jgi:hypothetical protein
VFLGNYLYDKGVETGIKKGRISGWNTGYKEGQESILEIVKMQRDGTQQTTSSDTGTFDKMKAEFDRMEINSKLDDIKRDINK